MQWTDAVTALSVAIIALAVVSAGIVGLYFLRDIARLTRALERFVETLDRDTRPVLDHARVVLTDATRVSGKLTKELEEMTDVATDVRERVVSAIDRVEDRLVDVDALLDVVQEEVEETVLDVGAALRTTRRGASVLGSIKNALGGKKKKKKRRRG